MNELDRQVFDEIVTIIESARADVARSVNFAMVAAYWKVGELIVRRQGGKERAEYGNRLIENLAPELTLRFGKSMDARELRRIRQFFLTYQNRDALSPELGWTHYRILIGVKDEVARNWYQQEAVAETWTTRQLQRQIGVLYYERMNNSADPVDTRLDAHVHLETDCPDRESIVHSPYSLPRDTCWSCRARTNCAEKSNASGSCWKPVSTDEQLYTKYKLTKNEIQVHRVYDQADGVGGGGESSPPRALRTGM